MQVRSITVTYAKQVSDGNYGNESAECSLSVDISEADEASVLDMTAELFNDVRKAVYAKLDESPSTTVRRGLRPS
jgi:hypothetical protein